MEKHNTTLVNNSPFEKNMPDEKNMDKAISYIPRLLRITSNDLERMRNSVSMEHSVLDEQTSIKTPTKALQELKIESKATSPVQELDKIEIDNMCRICYTGEINSDRLIAPCLCSGSTKFTHEKCLLEWFTVKKTKQCELCLYPIQINKQGMKPFWKWKRPKFFCDIVVSLTILYTLVMLMFVAMVTWIASSGHCYSPVCIVLYCLCLLAIAYFCYCCIYMGCMKESCHEFIQINRQLSVVGRQARLNRGITESKV